MKEKAPKKLWSKINYKKLLKKRLPITTWLPHYTISTFFQDFLAGLTVGMTEIPQGIAYATIAGLPPQYGLYSGLLDGFIYAIFGSCKDINIGPSSLLSIMVLPAVLAVGPSAVALLTFLSGAIILTLGILNLGFVIDFFSQPVTVGFITSGCIQITLGQLVTLLGLSGKSDTFINSCRTVVYQIQETRTWDVVLGVTSIVFLTVLKRIQVFGSVENQPHLSRTRYILKRFIFYLSLGRSALAIIIGTSLAYYFRDSAPFRITGHISAGFPTFQLPAFSTTFNGTEYNFQETVSSYGITLIVMPLLSIVESLTIAKTFNKAQGIDGTQEILALGFCNFIGSFIGSMPVTGSFSRTTVNNVSGVKTTMSGVFTSLLLALAIAFLTSTFYYVPKAILSAILMSAIMFILDYKTPIQFWKYRKLDLIPYFVALLFGLFVGLEYGLLIGALVHLTFVLYPSARPKLIITKEKSDGDSNVYTFAPNTLYFPAAAYLRDKVLKCTSQNGTVVINGKHILSMDLTVARAFATLIAELKLKNCTVFLLDFKPSVMDICIGVDISLQRCFLSEEAYSLILA